MNYITAKEAVEKRGISQRCVQVLCTQVKIGRSKAVWVGLGYSQGPREAQR